MVIYDWRALALSFISSGIVTAAAVVPYSNGIGSDRGQLWHSARSREAYSTGRETIS